MASIKNKRYKMVGELQTSNKDQYTKLDADRYRLNDSGTRTKDSKKKHSKKSKTSAGIVKKKSIKQKIPKQHAPYINPAHQNINNSFSKKCKDSSSDEERIFAPMMPLPFMNQDIDINRFKPMIQNTVVSYINSIQDTIRGRDGAPGYTPEIDYNNIKKSVIDYINNNKDQFKGDHGKTPEIDYNKIDSIITNKIDQYIKKNKGVLKGEPGTDGKNGFAPTDEDIKRVINNMVTNGIIKTPEVSDDKLNKLIRTYITNNLSLLKGKSGETPDDDKLKELINLQLQSDDIKNILYSYVIDNISKKENTDNSSFRDWILGLIPAQNEVKIDKEQFETIISNIPKSGPSIEHHMETSVPKSKTQYNVEQAIIEFLSSSEKLNKLNKDGLEKFIKDELAKCNYPCREDSVSPLYRKTLNNIIDRYTQKIDVLYKKNKNNLMDMDNIKQSVEELFNKLKLSASLYMHPSINYDLKYIIDSLTISYNILHYILKQFNTKDFNDIKLEFTDIEGATLNPTHI